MRVTARNVLVSFWGKHPEAKVSLERWHTIVGAAQWTSTDEVSESRSESQGTESRAREIRGRGRKLSLGSCFRFPSADRLREVHRHPCGIRSHRRIEGVAVLRRRHGNPAHSHRPGSPRSARSDRGLLGRTGGYGGG